MRVLTFLTSVPLFKITAIAAIATAAATGVVACSSTTSSAGFPPADGGLTDAGAVSLANATKIAADGKGGGFSPAAPDGSVCVYDAQHFAVDVATKLFTFKLCVPGSGSAGSPLVFDEGTKTLSADQYAKLMTSIDALTTTRTDTCGEDKHALSVTVTTPLGEVTYDDSFNACRKQPGITYVDNIDGVFSTFQSFVPAK